MTYMRSSAGRVFTPLVVSLGLLGCALVLIWILWPLVAPMMGASTRPSLVAKLVATTVLALVFAATVAVHAVLGQRSGPSIKQLGAQESEKGLHAGDDAFKHEVRIKVAAVLDALRGVHRRRLAETGRHRSTLIRDAILFFGSWGQASRFCLPWFLVIGGPGAGKTATISRCAIPRIKTDHPALFTQHTLRPTMNSEWVLTERAVFIDTSGRYVLQDETSPRDAHAWNSLLQVMRKARGRRPIDGVVLTVDCNTLQFGFDDELRRTAAHLRQRLLEIGASFFQNLPVYLVVTKLDTLSGFEHYFSQLSKEERNQPFGFTTDEPALTSAALIQEVEENLAKMCSRLSEGAVARHLGGSSLDDTHEVIRFPEQFRALVYPLLDLVSEIFSINAAQGQFVIRGIFFTSNFQGDVVIDPTSTGMQREIRLDARRVRAGPLRDVPFFTAGVLQDVVLAESALASDSTRWLAWRQRSLVAGIVLALVVGGWTGWDIYRSHAFAHDYLDAVETQVKALRPRLAGFRPDELKSGADILLGIDGFEFVPGLAIRAGVGWWFDPVAQVKHAVEDLRERLYKSVLVGLNQQMVGVSRVGDSVQKFDALRSYLFLNGGVPADAPADTPAVVASHLARHFRGSLGAESQGDRLRARKFAELLVRISSSRSLHSGATNEGKAMLGELGRVNVGAVAFQRYLYVVDAYDEGKARLSELEIKGADEFGFLELGIPPRRIFTRQHVDGHLALRAEENVKAVKAEAAWILALMGKNASGTEGGVAEFHRLYFDSYAAEWKGTIGAVRVKAVVLRNNSDGVIDILKSPRSPLAIAMRTFEQETSFRWDDDAYRGFSEEGNAALGTEYFRALKKFCEPDSGSASTANDRGVRCALRPELLESLRVRGVVVRPGEFERKISAVKEVAGNFPSPVSGVLNGVADSSLAEVSSSKAREIEDKVMSRFGIPCRQLIASYPFSPNGVDGPWENFVDTFKPSGAVVGQLVQELVSEVDMRSSPWRLKPQGGNLGGSPAWLASLQAAHGLGSAFFAADKDAAVRFSISARLSGGISSAILTVDGQSFREMNAGSRMDMKWPVIDSDHQVMLTTFPGGRVDRKFDGEWAFFRFLASASNISNVNDRVMRANFTLEGGRSISLEITWGGLKSPFPVSKFGLQCP